MQSFLRLLGTAFIAIGLGAPDANADAVSLVAYVANSGANTVSVIDVTTLAVKGAIEVGSAPTGIAARSDGALLYVSNSGDDTVSVIDTAIDAVVATIHVGPAPGSIVLSRDDAKLYVANTADNSVSIIDTATNLVYATIPMGPWTFTPVFPGGPAGLPHSHLAVSVDGTRVYVTNTYPFNQPLSSSLKVINTVTNSWSETIQLTQRNSGSVAITADGSIGYVTGWFGYFQTFNPATKLQTDAFTLSGGDSGISLAGIAIAPSGPLVYVTASEQNALFVINPSMQVWTKIPVGLYPTDVEITPDGALAYVTNRASSTVSVIDTGTQAVIATLNVGTYPSEVTFVKKPSADVTPPRISCAAADGVWHADNRVFECTAIDSESGLGNADDSSFELATSVAVGVETDQASTNAREVCDLAGNCSIAQVAGAKVDRRSPDVEIDAPESGSAFTVGELVLSSYRCRDSGSGLAFCSGSATNGGAIDTSTIGSMNFDVHSADMVGNQFTASANYLISYRIVPLYEEGKAYKIGSTLPVKIQLANASGINVSKSTVVVTAVQVFLVSTSAPGPLEDSGAANADLDFRYDGGQYIFNLSLKGFSKGTYGLDFIVSGDPVKHTLYFQTR